MVLIVCKCFFLSYLVQSFMCDVTVVAIESGMRRGEISDGRHGDISPPAATNRFTHW